MERDTRRLAIASVALGICMVTLIPVQPGLLDALRRTGFPVHEYIRGASAFSVFDALQNVLLFIPMGWLIASGGAEAHARSAWAPLRICFLLSGAVEVAQGWIPGRFPSVWDLAFNTLGGVAGAWLAHRQPSHAPLGSAANP